jgi:hypothetical protein
MFQGILGLTQYQGLISSAVEPEPEQEPQGAETFGQSWSRSWSQYMKLQLPGPALGHTEVVH